MIKDKICMYLSHNTLGIACRALCCIWEAQNVENLKKIWMKHTEKSKIVSQAFGKNYVVRDFDNTLQMCTTPIRFHTIILNVSASFMMVDAIWSLFRLQQMSTKRIVYIFRTKMPQNGREIEHCTCSRYLTVAKNQEHWFCDLYIQESHSWKFEFVTMEQSIFSVFWPNLEHRDLVTL